MDDSKFIKDKLTTLPNVKITEMRVSVNILVSIENQVYILQVYHCKNTFS